MHAGVEAKDCIKIKDMALKASVAYKNCKRCLRLCGEHRNQSCSDSDMSSKFHCSYQRTGCSYKRTGSSNSMLRQWGKGMESRLKVLSSGDGASSNDSQQVSIVRLDGSLLFRCFFFPPLIIEFLVSHLGLYVSVVHGSFGGLDWLIVPTWSQFCLYS
ncbi:hypothetical protein RchiOBHm_Chr5g0055791 [Rosa chinensis]|uniref:Uncharacterized protein n=1 Tax=Rosa chinensis TaxID=74649 RepID=A0A2P6QGH3_ROSCH|nr:hypothetical protein RchiOBHm_Chr5g0055791 [Rosa chinensis]